MVRTVFFAIAFLCFLASTALAQDEVVRFNKTAHDFGEVMPESRIEYDFIFRNISEKPLTVSRATAQGSGLEIIHTQSEILPGEYGFVKVKWLAPQQAIIANSLVTVEFNNKKSTWPTELYMRLETNSSAMAGDSKRAFADSPIATSVQVTAADIEGLEGFRGNDALSSAQAEIEYLKKQLEIKTDLILRLASDIDEKQQSEEESLQKLAQLQQTIQEWSEGKAAANGEMALSQVQSLGSTLGQWKSADSLWRLEIARQEKALTRLQQESDSAKAHAASLSAQLAERFAAEARAIQKAARLEKELAKQKATEDKQKHEIDSLQHQVAEQNLMQQQLLKTKAELEAELAWKLKEQQLQTAHTRHQHQKIEALKQENAVFRQRADSLHTFVSASDQRTDSLQKALAASDSRLRAYSSMLDSLGQASRNYPANESEASAAIDSLRQLLVSANEKDAALKEEIAQQNIMLADLQVQKAKSEKRVLFLQSELNAQSDEAMQLLQRMNRIATNESKARIEVDALKKELAQKQQQADSAMMVIAAMTAKMDNGEASPGLQADLERTQAEVSNAKLATKELSRQLEQQEKQLTANSTANDSLRTLVTNLEARRAETEKELAALKTQSSSTEQQLRDALASAQNLQKRLETARLSNQFAFEEMKGETENMRSERDQAMDENERLRRQIEELESRLSMAEKEERMATAFAEEMKTIAVEGNSKNSIIYKVQVLESPTEIAINDPRLKGVPELGSFYDRGKFRYTAGQEPDFKTALKLKEQMQDSGFQYALVLAFRDGKVISLKEALEFSN